MKNYLLGMLSGMLLTLAVQGGVWVYDQIVRLDRRVAGIENFLSHVPFMGR